MTNIISNIIKNKNRQIRAFVFSIIAFIILGALVFSYINSQVSASRLSVVGSFNATNSPNANDIFVLGQYAYLVTSNNSGSAPEFYILNIASTTSPILMGSLDVGSTVNKIFILRDKAYLVTTKDAQEFVVVDIADKLHPQILSSYDIPGTADGLSIFVTGQRFYDPYNSNDVYVPSITAYVGTENNTTGGRKEFYAFNVTNPSSISLLGSYEVSAHVRDIVIVRRWAFLATTNHKEFLILDVSSPSAMIETASYDLPTNANAVAYSHGKAYVVTNNNAANPDFFVFDVGNLVDAPSIQLLSALNLKTHNTAIEIFGTKAYIGRTSEPTGILVVDVANPASPTFTEQLSIGDNINAIGIGLRYLFTATNNDNKELQVIDPGVDISPITDVNADGFITIVCLGDSNTMHASFFSIRRSWCEYVEDYISNSSWIVRNRALAGMTAVDFGIIAYGMPIYVGAPVDDKLFQYLDAVIKNDTADVVMLAFGTVDIAAGATAQQLTDAYAQHRAKLASSSIASFVALTPPVFATTTPHRTQAINEANTLMLQTFPSSELLDFFSTMTVEDYYTASGTFDGIHPADKGQAKRAEEAYKKIILR